MSSWLKIRFAHHKRKNEVSRRSRDQAQFDRKPIVLTQYKHTERLGKATRFNNVFRRSSKQSENAFSGTTLGHHDPPQNQHEQPTTEGRIKELSISEKSDSKHELQPTAQLSESVNVPSLPCREPSVCSTTSSSKGHSVPPVTELETTNLDIPQNVDNFPLAPGVERMVDKEPITLKFQLVPRPLPPRKNLPPGQTETNHTTSDTDSFVKIHHPRRLGRLKPGMARNWETIKRLRIEIWTQRATIHKARGVLREKQEVVSQANDNILQFLRKKHAQNFSSSLDGSNPLEILANLIAQCETAKDEFGNLEAELNSLEDAVGMREFSLQKLESRFYETSVEEETVSNPEDDESDVPISSADSTSDVEQVYHPLVAEYLAKLGDVEILRERLDWHLDEKENLEDEKSKREIAGLDLALPDQEWLNDYEVVEQEILAELEIEEQRAEELRMRCYTMGLIDEDGDPTDFETMAEQTFNSDPKMVVEQPSQKVKYPSLIPPPNGLQDELDVVYEPKDHPLQNPLKIDPRLRVDKWLLHQLRMSPMDVNLLATTYDIETNGQPIGNDWQEHVLENWYYDKAGNWPSPQHTVSSEGLSRGLATHDDVSSVGSVSSAGRIRKTDPRFPATTSL